MNPASGNLDVLRERQRVVMVCRCRYVGYIQGLGKLRRETYKEADISRREIY